MNNCYFASHFSSEHLSDKGKAFNEAYRAKVQAAPPSLAALTYDAVWLVADALKRAGSAEPAAVRDALAATKDFPGVTGTITMGDDRNPKKPADHYPRAGRQFYCIWKRSDRRRGTFAFACLACILSKRGAFLA